MTARTYSGTLILAYNLIVSISSLIFTGEARGKSACIAGSTSSSALKAGIIDGRIKVVWTSQKAFVIAEIELRTDG